MSKCKQGKSHWDCARLRLFCFVFLFYLSFLSLLFICLFSLLTLMCCLFSLRFFPAMCLVVCFSTSLWVNGYLSLPVFFSYCNCLAFIIFFFFFSLIPYLLSVNTSVSHSVCPSFSLSIALSVFIPFSLLKREQNL